MYDWDEEERKKERLMEKRWEYIYKRSDGQYVYRCCGVQKTRPLPMPERGSIELSIESCQ